MPLIDQERLLLPAHLTLNASLDYVCVIETSKVELFYVLCFSNCESGKTPIGLSS